MAAPRSPAPVAEARGRDPKIAPYLILGDPLATSSSLNRQNQSPPCMEESIAAETPAWPIPKNSGIAIMAVVAFATPTETVVEMSPALANAPAAGTATATRATTTGARTTAHQAASIFAIPA